ncbi:hypothetical protein AB0F46_40385 [Streptomyces sp. NPDC026665]|uniref:hypothetical protein n=1 Tax=Streptomyces sp. NPDC026665 TaxID=3154798 RepID=UPI00340EED23
MHRPLTAAGLTAVVAGVLLATPVASITAARPETPAPAGSSAPATPTEHAIDRPADTGSPTGRPDSGRNPVTGTLGGPWPHRWAALVTGRP